MSYRDFNADKSILKSNSTCLLFKYVNHCYLLIELIDSKTNTVYLFSVGEHKLHDILKMLEYIQPSEVTAELQSILANEHIRHLFLAHDLVASQIYQQPTLRLYPSGKCHRCFQMYVNVLLKAKLILSWKFMFAWL